MNNVKRQQKYFIPHDIFCLDRGTTRCSIGLPGMELSIVSINRGQGITKNETGV